jgi:hypothetical protein
MPVVSVPESGHAERGSLFLLLDGARFPVRVSERGVSRIAVIGVIGRQYGNIRNLQKQPLGNGSAVADTSNVQILASTLHDAWELQCHRRPGSHPANFGRLIR